MDTPRSTPQTERYVTEKKIRKRSTANSRRTDGEKLRARAEYSVPNGFSDYFKGL